MATFSSRMISHFVIATAVAMRRGCPVRHPSPQNSSDPRTATTAFLALLGDNGDFDLALLDIENCIRRTALREDRLVLLIFGDSSPDVFRVQENFGIERRFSYAFSNIN
jgi:hypothetical protein